jgi:hypothetical protein
MNNILVESLKLRSYIQENTSHIYYEVNSGSEIVVK